MFFDRWHPAMLAFVIACVGCATTPGAATPGNKCQKPKGAYTITCTSEDCGGATCDTDQQETFDGAGISFKVWQTVSDVWLADDCQQDIVGRDPSTGTTEEDTVVCDEDGVTCDSTSVTTISPMNVCTIVTHWTLVKN